MLYFMYVDLQPLLAPTKGLMTEQGIPIPMVDREAAIKFVFEILSLHEVHNRQRADLALDEYNHTREILRIQELNCQREAANVNKGLAISAYFHHALKGDPTSNTAISLKAPRGKNGSRTSKEPDDYVYKSNCTFPRFSHMSRHSHLYIPGGRSC